MKWVWRALLIGALLVTVAVGAFFLGRDWRAPLSAPAAAEGGDQSEGAAEVQTAKVRQGVITETLDAYGAMQPKSGSSAIISVPFDARVLRVLTTPGAQVEPGTPVVEVGPTADVQLQLQQAKDTLDAATRTLEEVRRRLQEQLATNAEVTTAEAAERAARAQFQSLKQRGIEANKQVSAGVTGTVSQISVQPGQVISAGAAMMTIAPSAEMEAVVGVDPSLAVTLKPGDAVSLHTAVGAENGSPIIGKVHQVGRQINPQSRLCDVSIVPPRDSGLLPGAFVVAQIPAETDNGLIVPRSAVTLPDGNPVIFTIADGKAKKHAVTLGLTSGQDVEVKSDDVHAGDDVVTEGALELDDGAAVKIAEGPGSQPSASTGGEASTSPATAPRPEAP